MKYAMVLLGALALFAVGCCPGQQVEIRHPHNDDCMPNRIEQTAPVEQSSPIKVDGDCENQCPGCNGCPRG